MSNQSAITYEQIVIPGLEILHIEEFQLSQRVNEHTVLKFTATVDSKKEKELVNYQQAGSKIEVYYKKGDKQERVCMFRGMILDISVTEQNQMKHLAAVAISHTFLLDQEKRSRSYQKVSDTYKSLIKKAIASVPGAEVSFHEGADKTVNEFVLQYKETDWEFAKRLASRSNQGLIPAMDNHKPKFYYGVANNQPEEKMDSMEYSIRKDMGAYQIDSKNYIKGISEGDYTYYEIKSIQIKNVGDCVSFQGNTLYVRECTFCMEQGILRAYYQLGTKNSLKQRTFHNYAIQGLSLNGTVEEIVRDKVKVKLYLDGKNGSASYVFPYSTMSSSPDGSGWYCMPELGDEVRIYFPDREEKNCYAVSSASSYTPQPGEAKDRMGDPNVKYLRTPFGQEIALTPEGISINSNDGQAVISLAKDGTISIAGQKNISVSAKENLTLIADTAIQILAKDKICLENSHGASLELDESGNTVLKGAYVLEN